MSSLLFVTRYIQISCGVRLRIAPSLILAIISCTLNRIILAIIRFNVQDSRREEKTWYIHLAMRQLIGTQLARCQTCTIRKLILTHLSFVPATCAHPTCLFTYSQFCVYITGFCNVFPFSSFTFY